MNKMNWPTAFAAVFGTAIIVAGAIIMNDPRIVLALIPLYWLLA